MLSLTNSYFDSFVIFSLGVDTCDIYTVFSDAIGFVKQVTRLNNAVLGIRWTTWKISDPEVGVYKKSNTDKMFGMLQEAGVDKMIGQPINFFIRGHYAYRSRENLLDLYQKLNRTNRVTFTLYSDEQYYEENQTTPLNISEFRDAIEFLGFENVYLQVSDKVRADLGLHNLANLRATINSAPLSIQMHFILMIAFIAVKCVEFFVF